jgi:HAD superfamily hydrolase (TIGR01459 family)
MQTSNPFPEHVPEVISGVAQLVDHYDLVLCDVWGVLHNGAAAFPDAVGALRHLRKQGREVILVSNAPRPAKDVIPQLIEKLEVPEDAFDAVVTSGDMTRAAVQQRPGQVVHHLGPARDRPIFDELDVTFGSIEEAHYVVCSGFYDDERETAADYRERLERMRDRDLPMVCANPDLHVERGDRLIPCAGSIAQAYEAMGGQVSYGGKPHRPIYEASLERAREWPSQANAPSRRVLAIGDAVRTDILGASNFGVHSLLVARGIHSGELIRDGKLVAHGRIHSWLAAQPAWPTAIIENLTW